MTVKEAFRSAVWLLFALAGFYIVLFGQPISLAEYGLDQSWRIALQTAFDNHLIFGRDFIFTYGPLGFLSSRISAQSTRWLIFSYDLFIALQFALIWLESRRLAPSPLTPLLLFAICFVLAGASYYLDPPVVLFLFSSFWLFADRERPSSFRYLLSLLNALLSFYIKVNLGLAAFAQLLFAVAIDLPNREKRNGAIARLACALLGAYASTYLVNVDIPRYTAASLHIANGFNDAMYMEQINLAYLRWSLVSLALLACAAAVTFFLGRAVVLVLSCIGFSFLLFKQAFVRSDEHIFVFFDYIVVPFGILALFGPTRARIFNTLTLVAALAISIGQMRVSYSYVIDKAPRIAHYWDALHSDPAASQSSVAFSRALIQRVGNRSIDLMPDNTSLLFHAKLNYVPRPIIQSYSAYDSYLDRINGDFLRERGQDFIIFSHGCVDYRYCLYDETDAKLALLQHYDLALTDGGFFLLQRRTKPLTMKKTLLKSGKIRLGERIALPDVTGLLIVHFKIDYSLRGKVRRFLYKPYPLSATIARNGDKKSYRAIVPILQHGVIANRLVEDASSVELFLRREFSRIAKPDFIRLHSSGSRNYKKYFEYDMFTVEFNDQ